MRRELLLGTLLVGGTASLMAATLQGPPPAQASKTLQIEKVKDNLYLIPTGNDAFGPAGTFVGGNTAVFVTDSGVVVVDTKLAGWGQPLLNAIRTVTDKPVTTIINTHTHNDHTGSNTEFPATVNVVAHENTKANLARDTCAPVTNCAAFKGENAKYLPKTTFKDRMSLGSGRDQIDLYYFGVGHTNGDTWVVFPSVRVMHAGDMFPWKDAPFLDRGSGGSGIALPQSLARAVAEIKNVDTVIGGHQAMAPWKDLDEFQRFNQDILNAAQAAFKAGKSVDDAVTSINFEKYRGYQTKLVKNAVQAIYDELNQR